MFAILVGKIFSLMGGLINKGSSLPGSIALRLNRNILKMFKLPKNIIAVTGSSGKGTTSKMIASILRSQGLKVVHNYRGGNLKAGITTMLIEASTLTGKVNADYLVYEIDERYFKQVCKILKPGTVVITNLVRDQPPRQGHTDFVYEDIKMCLTDKTHLILNADDPYLQKFALETKYPITYYGIEKSKYSYLKNHYENLVIEYCPVCHNKLKYNYYHFEIYGDYYCPHCDFKRPNPKYKVNNIDYENGIMTINDKYNINILNNILYNIYNILATIATLGSLKFKLDDFIPYINKSEYDHKLCNHFKIKDRDAFVFYSKNENSTSFNQALNYMERSDDLKTVVVGWETISHRYPYNDISWIYDINFEILKNNNVNEVICVGPTCYDIATRIEIASIDKEKIVTFKNFNDSLDKVLDNTKGNIYFIVNPDYVIPLLKILKGGK